MSSVTLLIHALIPGFVCVGHPPLLGVPSPSVIQPSEVLGKIAKTKGGEAKIYPAFGNTPQEGHCDFATTSAGIAVWGDDVLTFIEAALR